MTFLLRAKDNLQIRLSLFIEKNWLTWLRVGFVPLSLIVAAGLGFIAAKRNPRYALLAAILPIVVVGIELILRDFKNAPLVILVTACFIPLSLPTGTGSRLVFSLVVTVGFTALWVIHKFIIEKRFWLYYSPVNRPLLGFVIVILFSWGWSIIFRDPEVVIWRSFPFVQAASALVWVMLPGALLLTANLIQDVKELKILVSIMLIAGFFGIFRQFGFINRLPVNTGGLFNMWVICLAVGQALFNEKLDWKIRGPLLGLAAIWVYWGFVLHIDWLAGWLPGFVAVGILTVRRSWKLALVIGAVLLIWVGLHANYYLYKTLGTERNVSGVTRVGAWIVNWRITKYHILFGTGPAGYASYYMTYFPTEGLATHSNYLDILAQTGIIGSAFCAWLFLSLTVLGLKVTSRINRRRDFWEGLSNSALAGTIGCIVMMGFGDWLLPFAYTQTIAGYNYAVYNWIFMGTLLVIDRLTKEKTDAYA